MSNKATESHFYAKDSCFRPDNNSQVYKLSKIRKVIENTSFYKRSFILYKDSLRAWKTKVTYCIWLIMIEVTCDVCMFIDNLLSFIHIVFKPVWLSFFWRIAYKRGILLNVQAALFLYNEIGLWFTLLNKTKTCNLLCFNEGKVKWGWSNMSKWQNFWVKFAL